MSALPHGVADPLHINEPFPIWTLVVAGLMLWLLYRLVRFLKQRSAEAISPPPSPSLPAPRSSRIAAVIEDIRRRYRERKAYRSGCHELAAALREHFDSGHSTKDPMTTLTAAEMTRRIGDTAVSRLFGVLSELQFYRRPPTQSDFDGACDLALEVAESRGRFGRRTHD